MPTFVSTFNAPVPAIVSSSGQALSGISAQLPPSIAPLSMVSFLADQPFVVGPGYSPVPAKLVSQIRGGKFVDLSELLAANLVSTEAEPQVMLDGRLVLSAPPKKPRRRIKDITTWTEAFTVYSLVLSSFFPHRWKDLSLYKLLILRIARQFSGLVWLAYDKALREHAAATRLADWSTMKAQLFTFHAGGASPRSPNLGTSQDSSEPVGSSSSRIPCMSWNKGRCTAAVLEQQCQFLLAHGLAASTRRSYASGQRKFVNFCAQLGKLHPSGSPCPTNEWTLCLFPGWIASALFDQSLPFSGSCSAYRRRLPRPSGQLSTSAAGSSRYQTDPRFP